MSKRRDAAIFTITQNETWMKSKWLEYYSKHFDPRDIFILNHCSPSTSVCYEPTSRYNLINVYYGYSFDHLWLKDTVSAFQSFLLQSYAYTVFAEIDEFIVPDPHKYPGGLCEYMDTLCDPHITCNGYEVHHKHQEETNKLVLKCPLLGQRKYWHRSVPYSKPLVANHQIDWVIGFHEAYNVPLTSLDPDLYLIHLKKVDFDRLLKCNIDASKRQWSEFDCAQGYGKQHWCNTVESLTNWFKVNESELELIPERFKSPTIGI